MSKLSDIAEMAGEFGEVADIVEAVIDVVGEKKELMRKFFGVLVSAVDSIHVSALDHDGYHTNFAKSRFALFSALKAEGFNEDQALLLMVDNDIKMTKLKGVIQNGTSGRKKE